GTSTFAARVDGETVVVTVPHRESIESLHWFGIDGRSYEVDIDSDMHWIKSSTGLHRIEVRDLEAAVTRPVSGDARVKAPIPGLVTRIFIKQGDMVSAGERLLILEAMKMENEITAP